VNHDFSRPGRLVPEALPASTAPTRDDWHSRHLADPTSPAGSSSASATTAPAGNFDPATRQAEQRASRLHILRNAPPWVVSAVFHMTLLVVLGLVVISDDIVSRLSLEATLSDKLGDASADPIRNVDSITEPLDPEALLTPKNLDPVDDPLAAPQLSPPVPEAHTLRDALNAPQIGIALQGRERGMKEALLAAYGGNKTTESSVLEGLKWLAKQQLRDGSWSLKGPYADGSYSENGPAATAMAMLAFLGAGHTFQDEDASTFAPVVRRALRALLKFQDADGNFFKNGPINHRLYTQAQCTMAICELFAMTGDEQLRGPAQLAIDYCVRAQSPEGGWRYLPGTDSDTSVTGWVVMALKSGRMSYLAVPQEVWDGVDAYLDRASVEGGRRYVYRPGEPFQDGGRGLAMTAEALLCRQYLGWPRTEPRLVDGVAYLARHPMSWDARNAYYWYYATQVCHHMGGEPWQDWNGVMRNLLPARQIRAGRERGSWDPKGDAWGPHGGRLFVTALSIYMLEVYYRHLPLYRTEMLSSR